MTDRLVKINELIKQEVGKIILKEVDIPMNVLVTVTRAETSPNLRISNVFITTFPEGAGKDIIRELELNVYDIQKSLNRKLHMKPVPKISFKTDKQAQAEQKIYKILGKESK